MIKKYTHNSVEGDRYRKYVNFWAICYLLLAYFLSFSYYVGSVQAKEPMFPIEKQERKPLYFGEKYVDLEKLANAVANHETCGCTCGVGATHNNCMGIKQNGKFVRFSSKARSYQSFFWNWEKHYGNKFPDIEMAKRWSGSDRYHEWLSNVTYFYENS